MKPIHIACVGGWHSHARDFPMDRAKKFCSHIPYSIDAVWDDDPARGMTWAAEMGCKFQPDYGPLTVLSLLLEPPDTPPSCAKQRLPGNMFLWKRH